MSFQQKDPKIRVTEHLSCHLWASLLLELRRDGCGLGRVSEEKAVQVPMVSVALWELSPRGWSLACGSAQGLPQLLSMWGGDSDRAPGLSLTLASPPAGPLPLT